MNRTAVQVGALLCAVLLCALLLAGAAGRQERQPETRLQLVATFYPVYILTRNLTDGVEGVRVQNLVPATTGCLHDYQLSPQELVSLRGADALILNGAGAETFLDPVRRRYPDLTLIDSSTGIPLLSEEHDHGAEHDHDHAGLSHDGDTHSAYNSHLWVSPSRYLQQLSSVCEGLCALDPDQAEAYRSNAARYAARIGAVAARLRQAAAALPSDISVVLFHDSLSYLADDLGLPVLATLSVGEEEGVSAAALSGASDRIRAAGPVLFLYDAQYRDLTYAYLARSAARSASLFLNTAVSGDDDPDAWCRAMESIATALEEVTL